MQQWEDATSCIISGCYETGIHMGYSVYRIPNSTCSIYRGEETPVAAIERTRMHGSASGASARFTNHTGGV